MYGVLFYAMIADVAAGEYIRLPNGLSQLEQSLTGSGLCKKEWDDGWKRLEKYQSVFENSVFQNVLILMRSHWDWYIRQISEFIRFARNYVASPVLDKKQQKLLHYVDRKDIKEQLLILEMATGLGFNISASTLSSVDEMSLVRNLGLHNRWEVDTHYLAKTSSSTWELKDVRFVSVAELGEWRKSLWEIIDKTVFPVAIKYVSAPDYHR